MQPNFFEHLEALLKTNKAYVAEDGRLLRNKVAEAAATLDPGLLRLLLSDAEAKKRFFADVDGTVVFDKTAFGWVVENRAFLPDSFTRFKNRIGLTDTRGEFLASFGDVVLSFPYKDCVLEGGQTKEDQKRSEVFYNRTLAPDEIDRLLDPKALCHAIRHDKDGSHPATSFDPAADNLVLKGNNLLALASLLPRYEGKVKLIYIDPPFNTGNDEFGYNDSFNHSTWLVFMENRLELAARLLSHDGVVCVNIGNEEVSYLEVLLAELFNRENFLNHITMSTNEPSGFKSTGSTMFSTANHLLLFAKDKSRTKIRKLFVRKDYDEAYKYYLENRDDPFSKWKFVGITEAFCAQNGITRDQFRGLSKAEKLARLSAFADANRSKVFRTAAINGGAFAKRKATIEQSKSSKGVVFRHPGEDLEGFFILNGEQIVFWENRFRDIDGETVPAMELTDVWTDIGWTGIAGEGGVKLKNGKKPEKLLRRILELTTDEGDLILDYHVGSGTTCAVAHKMKRRYIGIEQLNYGDNDSIRRLENVINGDKTGVSKVVGWTGGGSFVSCELAKCNAVFAEEIAKAADDAALTALLWKILDTGYASHRVWTKDVKGYETEFAALPTEEKRNVLFDLLDANMLYVNRSDADDAESGLSDADKAFTRSFYGE